MPGLKGIFNSRAMAVSFLLLLASCSAKQGQNPDTLTPIETSREWFNPFSDAEDTTIATRAEVSGKEWISDNALPPDTTSLRESIYPSAVYRVQVFATQYYYRALEEKQVAAEALAQAARVSYHVPYYRVQVGNARTRAGAERLLQLARQLGYEQSWIVEEQVDSLFWIHLAADSAAADTAGVAGQQE